MSGDADGPHQGQPLETAGANLDEAEAAVALIHGRGATAASMLQFAREFEAEADDGIAYLAPQAQRSTWYPQSFLAPMESNQPHLSSALRRVGEVLTRVEDAGITAERTMLVGFSQGACLASEYVARNARRYGGLAALSGGVIGPEGTPRDYDGSVDGTPVFLGCSDRDPHIPLERVRETAEVFEDLDGDVTERIYEGMGHTVNDDELAFVSEMVSALPDR